MFSKKHAKMFFVNNSIIFTIRMPLRHIIHNDSLTFWLNTEICTDRAQQTYNFQNVCLGSRVSLWAVCAICWSNSTSVCWTLLFFEYWISWFLLPCVWWKWHIDVALCLLNHGVMCESGVKKSLRIRGGLVSIEPH